MTYRLRVGLSRRIGSALRPRRGPAVAAPLPLRQPDLSLAGAQFFAHQYFHVRCKEDELIRWPRPSRGIRCWGGRSERRIVANLRCPQRDTRFRLDTDAITPPRRGSSPNPPHVRCTAWRSVRQCPHPLDNASSCLVTSCARTVGVAMSYRRVRHICSTRSRREPRPRTVWRLGFRKSEAHGHQTKRDLQTWYAGSGVWSG